MKAKLIKENDFYYLKVDGKIIADIDGHPLKSINLKLSKQNCDEIFGAVDVEKLACDECHIDISAYKIIQTLKSGHSKSELQLESKVDGFILGFNKAVALNKNKLFTVEDLIIAFFIGRESLDKAIVTVEEAREKIISSLYSPTEIEVEICCYIGNGDKESDSFKDPLVTNTGIPKLDENDCLILKKI